MKAAAIRQETLETFSATLNQRVQAKVLFMYANQQQGEMLKAQLQDGQCTSSDRAFIQAKIDILERALRVKSVDYLKELDPYPLTQILLNMLYFRPNRKILLDKLALRLKEFDLFILKAKTEKFLQHMMHELWGQFNRYGLSRVVVNLPSN